jgi:hypothetical protein
MNDKVLLYIEEKLIQHLLAILITIYLINTLLIFFTKYGLEAINLFFTTDLLDFFIKKEGTLVNIAAIFIGIYFTVFTILGAVRNGSKLARLSQENFNKVVLFIKNAFIGAFLYIFFTLFIPFTTVSNENIKSLFSLLLTIFILYMLLSSVRLGIIIYVVFKEDYDYFSEGIKAEQEDERRIERLILRIEEYLEMNEKNNDMVKVKKVQEVLKQRNKEQ